MKAWPRSALAVALELRVAHHDARLADAARRAARPAQRSERAQTRLRRVDERLPRRRIAAGEQPDHLAAPVQVPHRAAARADLAAPARRRVAVPEEHAAAVGAIGVPADGAVRRDGAGVALRAEPGQLPQVLDAADVGVANRVHVAVGGRLAAHRDAVVVDVLDEHLPAAQRGDLDNLRPPVAGHEAERAAAAQLVRDHQRGRPRAVTARRLVVDAGAAAHAGDSERKRRGEGE